MENVTINTAECSSQGVLVVATAQMSSGVSITVGIMNTTIYPSNNSAQIVEFCVNPLYRRSHIGRRMWDETLSYIKATPNIRHIEVAPYPHYCLPLSQNEPEPPAMKKADLVDIYKKLGFDERPKIIRSEKYLYLDILD